MHRHARTLPVLVLLAAALAAQGSSAGTADEAYKPGVGGWHMYRGDFLSQGVSYGRRPAYKGEKWKYFTAGSLTSSAVVVDGMAIVANEAGLVHAVDVKTGHKVWTSTIGGGEIGRGVSHTSPLVHGGRLYLGSRDGAFYCLSVKDGGKIWEVQLTEARDRFSRTEPIYASPKGDERGIVVPTMDDKIYCLDPATGAPRWTVDARREMGSTPVILGNHVYVASKGRRVFDIAYDSGKVERELIIPHTTHCSPACAMGYLVLTMGSDVCGALDLVPSPPGAEASEEGALRWTVQSRSDARNGMTVAGKAVYYPDGTDVVAADIHTGREMWRFRTTYKPCDPVVVGPDILIASRDGVIKVVDRESGQEHHSFEVAGKIHHGPIVVDGLIFQPTVDNYLVCFE